MSICLILSKKFTNSEYLSRAVQGTRNQNRSCARTSEYSLPPSYRVRNNLLRIPAIISGSSNQSRNIDNDNNAIINMKRAKSNSSTRRIDQLYLDTNDNRNHETVGNETNSKRIETNIDNNLVTIVAITDCTVNESPNTSGMDILAHL